MKKNSWKILLILVAILIPVISLKAAADKNGLVFVATDEVITGNLIAAGENVLIDGTISGDLITASQSLIVNGRVEGDIIAIAQNIDIKGEVGGNIRVVGNNVDISSVVTRNLNVFGSNIMISENARVGWDAILGGSTVITKGNINGFLDIYAQNASLDSKIGKNARINIYNESQNPSLSVSKNTTINGDLDYTANVSASIDNQAVISGQTNFHKSENKKNSNTWPNWVWGRLFAFLSTILIGLVLVFILPKNSTAIINKIRSHPGKSVLIGAIITLATPLLLLLLMVTIIGLPLALILFLTVLAGVLLSTAVSSLLLGSLIVQNVLKKNLTSLFWPLVLGVAIITLLSSLPYLGWLISLAAIWFGLGGIILYVSNQSKNI